VFWDEVHPTEAWNLLNAIPTYDFFFSVKNYQFGPLELKATVSTSFLLRSILSERKKIDYLKNLCCCNK